MNREGMIFGTDSMRENWKKQKQGLSIPKEQNKRSRRRILEI